MNLNTPTREQQERGLTSRGRQTGLTDRIREVLRAGPLTADQIAHRLGASRATVQPLMRLLSKAAGIYRVGGNRRTGFVYSLERPRAEAGKPPRCRAHHRRQGREVGGGAVSHRTRILTVLAELPYQKGKPRGLARTVLEGLARTPQDKRAAPALVDYMLALGEIVRLGERRGAVYGLPKVRAG